MKTNILAGLYFVFGYITSFFMMSQAQENYIVFGGVTLFFYLTFSLTDALEDLGLWNYNYIYCFTQLKIQRWNL